MRTTTARLNRGAAPLLAALSLWTLILIDSTAKAQNTGAGKELFAKRCAGCHALDSEKEGPRLRGVYGRVSGSVPTFTYSDALKKAGITWDAGSLEKWLTDPDALVRDNDMAFQLRSAQERDAIIVYLRQLSKP